MTDETPKSLPEASGSTLWRAVLARWLPPNFAAASPALAAAISALLPLALAFLDESHHFSIIGQPRSDPRLILPQLLL